MSYTSIETLWRGQSLERRKIIGDILWRKVLQCDVFINAPTKIPIPDDPNKDSLDDLVDLMNADEFADYMETTTQFSQHKELDVDQDPTQYEEQRGPDHTNHRSSKPDVITATMLSRYMIANALVIDQQTEHARV